MSRRTRLWIPATVLVSEAVATVVGGTLAVEPVGSYEVKGRSEKVQAFRLTPE